MPENSLCPTHKEVVKRYDEKFEQQDQINRDLFSKLNAISSKMNWILGAVAVGWPLVLVILHLLTRRVP